MVSILDRMETDQVNVGQTERVLSLVGGWTLLVVAAARRDRSSIPLALGGAALVIRGLTGYSLIYRTLNIQRTGESVLVERAVSLDCPVDQVYQFWRNYENFPSFMHYLESVRAQSDGRSHWVAKGPLGSKVEWDAVTEEERPNTLIAWRSLPGSEIENAGRVEFKPGPGRRGTVVAVRLSYNPPAGSAGSALAKIFGAEPDVEVREALRHFKEIMEAGEIPNTEGQPSGRERVQ